MDQEVGAVPVGSGVFVGGGAVVAVGAEVGAPPSCVGGGATEVPVVGVTNKVGAGVPVGG